MQARNFIDSFFLYVAKDGENLSSILSDQLPSAASKNGVILYPNPNSHMGSSSNGACDYRARVIIEGQEHKDVSIGNQLLSEKGFLTVKSNNHYGKLIGIVLEKANVQQAIPEPAYHPNAVEVASDFLLPPNLANIVFDYLASSLDKYCHLLIWGDFKRIIKGVVDFNFLNMPTVSQCAQYTLFGRSYLSEQKTVEMTRLGSMVLSGEEEDVETVLREVKKNPELLDIVITAKDPLGALITGTLLQLAAMAGDFDLRFYAPSIVNEKERGLVQRLIIAGNIPEEKVLKQLECINSEDAKRENDARIQRYVQIIQQFENGNPDLQKIAIELCKERLKAVNAGFIFDPRILINGLLIIKGLLSHGGSKDKDGRILLIKVFGGLQCLLSSRDAQAMVAGIDNCKHQMTKRTLKNTCFDPRHYPNGDLFMQLGADYCLVFQGQIIRNDTSIDRANLLLLLDKLKLHLETFLKPKETDITYLTSSKEKSAVSKRINGCSLM